MMLAQNTSKQTVHVHRSPPGGRSTDVVVLKPGDTAEVPRLTAGLVEVKGKRKPKAKAS